MSATIIEQARPRLQRSQLAVPGSNAEFIEKAAKSPADVVFLDCEDAVAPNDKELARKNIIAALNDLDWGTKTLQVRINGLDTQYMYKDVVDIVEQCPRLDMILIPKVGVPADVYAVDMLVSQIELATKRKKKLGFDLLIETALGMANVEAIAQSSPRLESLSFGVADYAASTRARTTVIGGASADYGVLTGNGEDSERHFHWNDMYHFAQARINVACRAYGLRPIDGPFGDFSDDEGFLAQARRSAALGCVGKWAIHPKQVALANSVFTPSEAQITEAREILAAMEEAERTGQGAAVYKGRLVDIASIRQARVIVRQSEMIGG